MHKQTCNGEYTKHSTRSRHQLKLAIPADVSKKRSTFRVREFKEKCHFNIAANLMLNTVVSFIVLLIAHTARIACQDRLTDRQADTQENYVLYIHIHVLVPWVIHVQLQTQV